MRVALACHSPWLRAYLAKSAAPGVAVTLVESMQVAARRAGIDRFDALIVDEGQDLLNMDALSRLDEALRGGIENGRWCFFHDRNNQSGLCGEYAPDAYIYLESFGPAKIPLRTNCRNTLPILSRIHDTLNADLGTSGVGDGPAVRETTSATIEEAAHLLGKELERLVDRDGFDPSEIVILSPKALRHSCAALLPSGFHLRIVELDEYSPRGAGRGAIGFAEIESFKGLESPVVVLVDLPPPSSISPDRALHYVGMSRARVLLSMVCCSEKRAVVTPPTRAKVIQAGADKIA
jgi:hypothetical protein